MVAFNFQARFALQVESGEKRQTVRAERKDGRPPCGVGQRLQLYIGMRTKACRKLVDPNPVCRSIQAVRITSDGTLWIDDHYKPRQAAQWIAIRDGFNGWLEMRQWFADTHGLPFRGWLISW